MEESDEPIQEIVTCDLALSIPRGVGAEVPVSDVDRRGWGGDEAMYTRVLRADALRDQGDECAGGPCALGSDDTTESVGIGVYGDVEGAKRDTAIEPVSATEAKTLLG